MQALTEEQSTRLPPFPGELEFSETLCLVNWPNEYFDVPQAFKVPQQTGRKSGSPSPQFQHLVLAATMASVRACHD